MGGVESGVNNDQVSFSWASFHVFHNHSLAIDCIIEDQGNMLRWHCLLGVFLATASLLGLIIATNTEAEASRL